MNSDPSIQKLISGYQKFKQKYFLDKNTYESLVRDGQSPQILAIGCCDSRVDPAIIAGSEPGELFIVRNVANLVPPINSDPQYHSTSAAVEFAVNGLNVKHVIILGHSDCGGMNALMTTDSEDSFVYRWVSIASKAKEKVLAEHADAPIAEQCHHCEKASLAISIDNLMSFPFVREKVESGKLVLHAWYFNMNTGNLEEYNASDDSFSLI